MFLRRFCWCSYCKTLTLTILPLCFWSMLTISCWWWRRDLPKIGAWNLVEIALIITFCGLGVAHLGAIWVFGERKGRIEDAKPLKALPLVGPNCRNQNFFRLAHDIFTDAWAKQIGVIDICNGDPKKGKVKQQRFDLPIQFIHGFTVATFDQRLSGRWSRRSNVKKVLACAILAFQMFEGVEIRSAWFTYRDTFFVCLQFFSVVAGCDSFFLLSCFFLNNSNGRFDGNPLLPS